MYYLKLIYIFFPWTTHGTPVGQDFVHRTHDLQNEFEKQNFTKNCLLGVIFVLLLRGIVPELIGTMGLGKRVGWGTSLV